MFAGHFGVAAAVKSKSPELPLWSLLVSSQLLDIAFVPFYLAGVETMEPIGKGGYGHMLFYAFYTHSFFGALLLTIVAAFIAGRIWGKKSGAITGAVVFSHWLLDLIVHYPDMSIFPGNAGNFPLLGFGLWNSFFSSFLLEFFIIVVGSFFYYKYALQSSGPERKGKAIAAGCIMTVFLFFSLGITFL